MTFIGDLDYDLTAKLLPKLDLLQQIFVLENSETQSKYIKDKLSLNFCAMARQHKQQYLDLLRPQ